MVGTGSTGQVSILTLDAAGYDKTLSYTYSVNGNILSVSMGGKTTSYVYDTAGQLLRENNQTAGKPWVWTYDDGGNILSRKEYTYTTGKLLRENIYDAGGNLTDTLDFFYDHNGHPYELNHTANGTTATYYYITNLQGDVLAMITANGVSTASYTYDPYGKVLSASGTMAEINPLRYRGYYYDTETGFYYLQSRYYDPTICRFINADSYTSTGQGIIGYNMFVYCGNNPASRVDSYGYFHNQVCYTYFDGAGGTSANPDELYINSQREEPVGSKRFGLTTISHGGCGVVATYNALISLGDYRDFDEVLSYYNENFWSLNLGGYAGMMPDLVVKYFEDYGYKVIVTDDVDGIDIYSKTADASILWILYSAKTDIWILGTVDSIGGHFVAYTLSEQGYLGHNTGLTDGAYAFMYPSDFAYRSSQFYAVGIFIFKEDNQ